MNPRELIRSATHVHSCLEELPDGRVIAKKQVKIYSPYNYLDNKLVTIGQEIWILGIFGITTEDRYLGVSLLNTMVPISPTHTNRVKIDGDEYFEFVFNPGDSVFPATTLVKSDSLIYKIYDTLISKGQIPWYVGYSELGRLFESAKEFAGANIGGAREVGELIASMLARDPKDRTKYYRQVVQSTDGEAAVAPVFVGLKSVAYSASNTTNKLGGSYFQVGVTSALISPSSRRERVEALLMK